MVFRNSICNACAALALWTTSLTDAGTLEIPEWFNGSVSAAWWSGSRELDDRHDLLAGAAWLKAQPAIGSLRIVTEALVRNNEMRAAGDTQVCAREAFVAASHGPMDVRIGKQIIVWGRADQINPTDNLTPRDFTALVPESGDDRRGTQAVQLQPRWGNSTVSLLWLPQFAANVLPLPPGTVHRIPRDSGQFAIKFDRSGAGGIDWSLSWYSGFDLNPTVLPGASGSVTALHPRIDVIGGDFAVPIGRFGVRGEVAYTRTQDDAGVDPLQKNTFLYAVLGVDRTFAENLNLNLQYYAYLTRRYTDPRKLAAPEVRALALFNAALAHQLDRREHGVAVRLSNQWLNETLRGEIAALIDFDGNGFLVKPKLTYALNDALRLTLGADLYRGTAHSSFDLLSSNSAAYGELRLYF